jgi:dihydropteroate synthase
MGILNATPDSFSDGGKFYVSRRSLQAETETLETAVARGLQMVEEGADIIDIGGESTRPGAKPVQTLEEIERTVPIIGKLREKTDALISIDTRKAEVARAAVAAGADIINDVSALADPEMVKVAAETITQDLAKKAPYFSVDAVRSWLAEQKMSYAPDTVKTYLSRQKKEGKIFDAGRGWYSSIAKPYQLDTAPVEKLVGELKTAFPLLDFACWSTEQLNEMLRHQLAKHVQFACVERDAIDSVADWLKGHGYKTYANPGKQERKRFSIEEKTVVILPLTSESPRQNGFATIEKIVVDVLADTEPFSIINTPEFIDGASESIKSQRIDISELMKYSTRRKTDISSLINGLVIH